MALSAAHSPSVLDGQHRVEGLKALGDGHPPFEVNISVFIGMDIESQAYLFSVVNLTQTKVNRSLVYDLFEFSRARSPQKTSHKIAVALDATEKSPLYKRVKRLGVATHGRFTETLTQATFVESLLPYISDDPVKDRDMFLRGKKPLKAEMPELRRTIFRNMFLEERALRLPASSSACSRRYRSVGQPHGHDTKVCIHFLSKVRAYEGVAART